MEKIKTPVVILGYSRPKETKILIELINRINPMKVYFFVDFPRTLDPKLIKLNSDVKELKKDFNSEIILTTHYFESNLGPWNAYNECLQIVFEKEDRLIYLEDDKLPSLSFFDFCDQLLDKYKDDYRISLITGLNKYGTYPLDYPYDYFFSYLNHHEGHAMWKRSYQLFSDYKIIYTNEYYHSLYRDFFANDKENRLRMRQLSSFVNHGKYRGAPPSMEFFNYGPLQFLSNSIVIVPTRNLIKEVGATEYTVHGDEMKLMTKRQQRLFFRETYEIEKEIKHPPYIVSDKKYFFTKRWYSIFVDVLDKFDRIYRIIRYKGIKGLIAKLKTKLKILLNRDY